MNNTTNKIITPKKNYNIVCFDVDGTLIDNTIFIWQTLHDRFRTDSLRRQLYKKQFFSGQISYDQWFYSDLELLKEAGADKSKIIEIFRDLKPIEGAYQTVYSLKEYGLKIAVVSGSIDLLLKIHFPDIQFDYILINEIHFDDDGKIIGGKPTQFDLDRKAEGLRYIAQREGIDLEKTVFVGDNFNDIEIAKIAGLSISFNCVCKELQQISRININTKNLRDILQYII